MEGGRPQEAAPDQPPLSSSRSQFFDNQDPRRTHGRSLPEAPLDEPGYDAERNGQNPSRHYGAAMNPTIPQTKISHSAAYAPIINSVADDGKRCRGRGQNEDI